MCASAACVTEKLSVKVSMYFCSIKIQLCLYLFTLCTLDSLLFFFGRHKQDNIGLKLDVLRSGQKAGFLKSANYLFLSLMLFEN